VAGDQPEPSALPDRPGRAGLRGGAVVPAHTAAHVWRALRQRHVTGFFIIH